MSRLSTLVAVSLLSINSIVLGFSVVPHGPVSRNNAVTPLASTQGATQPQTEGKRVRTVAETAPPVPPSTPPAPPTVPTAPPKHWSIPPPVVGGIGSTQIANTPIASREGFADPDDVAGRLNSVYRNNNRISPHQATAHERARSRFSPTAKPDTQAKVDYSIADDDDVGGRLNTVYKGRAWRANEHHSFTN